MKFTLTKKDIIGLNQEFEADRIHNEPSLDFSLSYPKRTTNWTKSLAWIVRALGT